MARVVDHVAEHAAHTPDAVAVSCQGEETTYSQLIARVNAIAHVLHQQGIGKGDYVGIMLQRCAHGFARARHRRRSLYRHMTQVSPVPAYWRNCADRTTVH